MKTFKLFFLAVASVAIHTSAFAEDYYVPIRKELEPMARIQLKNYLMDGNQVTYTLPVDLTGEDHPITIEAVRVGGNNFAVKDVESLRLLPRIYEAPKKAVLSCIGSDILPACSVTHTNLNINLDEVRKFASKKYLDPKKIADAVAVAEQFSSSEPIGFISKRALPPKQDVPKKWKVAFPALTAGQSPLLNGIEASLDFEHASFVQTQGNEEKGIRSALYRLFEHGQHWSGVLEFGDERRWIDAEVSTDRTVLTGTWGEIDKAGNAKTASGTFKGKAF